LKLLLVKRSPTPRIKKFISLALRGLSMYNRNFNRPELSYHVRSINHNIPVGAGFWDGQLLAGIVGEPAPCILKESGDRSRGQSVDRAVNQALATSQVGSITLMR